jgi:hypothetical protein
MSTYVDYLHDSPGVRRGGSSLRVVPARVHDRTPVCGAARRCAQINTDRANGASGAASDAADDLAASMQLGGVSVSIGGLVMNRMILVLAMTAATIATGAVARAEARTASGQSPFRFQFEESESHRGVAVEGYVYNTLPWRITNVRLQVDSIDANGMLTASASGWVLGDVAAGGRGYFYVPVSAHAPTYRPTVQRFDKVMLEAPQAP